MDETRYIRGHRVVFEREEPVEHLPFTLDVFGTGSVPPTFEFWRAPFWAYAAVRRDDGGSAVTKREGIWILWGLGLGAVAWVVLVYGFGIRAHAYGGRFGILMLAGAGLAYLAAKIMRIGKQT